jgi:F-type H+-transporting ATPase subunit epsilon
MPKGKLHCSLITPEARVFEGEVEYVSIPAHDGEIGILHNRAPLVCALGSGRMTVRTGATEENWFIDAGFAQVLENRVIVLTQKATRTDQIDRGEAFRQLEQARRMPTKDDTLLRRRARAEDSARAKLRLTGGSQK